jgi:hypothetical protein
VEAPEGASPLSPEHAANANTSAHPIKYELRLIAKLSVPNTFVMILRLKKWQVPCLIVIRLSDDESTYPAFERLFLSD